MMRKEMWFLLSLCLLVADHRACSFQSPVQQLCAHKARQRYNTISTSLPVKAVSSERDDDLLPDAEFERYCQIDKTIRTLRHDLPNIRKIPLDRDAAIETYAPDFKLVGPNNEELATDREELISLSTALVAGTVATQQAQQFARSFATTSTTSSSSTTNNNDKQKSLVSCNITLDAVNMEMLLIDWKTPLLGGTRTSGNIRGTSVLSLNRDGLVSKHKLMSLAIDGQALTTPTAADIGNFFATLRRAVKSFSDSPLLAPFATSLPLLTEIRDEFLLQQQQTNAQNGNVEANDLPQIFVATNWTLNDKGNVIASGRRTLVDDVDSSTIGSFPLPGSGLWLEYQTSRTTMNTFLDTGLKLLSSAASPKESVSSLFDTDATLYGIDETILITGGHSLAEFYQTLASIRTGTMSDWKAQRTAVDDDWKNRSVVVDFVATTNPVRVEGRDRIYLNDKGLITKIQQLELSVGGNKLNDPEWFRQFVQSIETGKNNRGGKALLELLKRIDRNGPPDVAVIEKKPLELSKDAAASVYSIMCAFHQDLASIATLKNPPASDYISPSVELRGYLDEVLCSDESSYRRVVGVLLTSFRAALASGSVTIQSKPTTTVSFQSDGQIRVEMVINLALLSGFKIPSPVTTTTASESSSGGGGGFPLKLQFVSVYRYDQNAQLVLHRITETRVNDQLTPADVVARFIQQQQSNPSDTTQNNLPLLFVDALQWARKLGRNS